MNPRTHAEWTARNAGTVVVLTLAPVLWALLIAWLISRAT